MASPKKAKIARGHKGAHQDLTAKFVREILDYDPKTGILRWKKQLGRARIGAIAGSRRPGDLRNSVGIKRKTYYSYRLIWLWVTGEWPTYEIDHRNENASDDRWKNLRIATPSQNHRNRGKQANNTSGYKGVTFSKEKRKWRAEIMLNQRHKHVGYFNTRKEAYKSVCKVAKVLHGKKWSKYV